MTAREYITANASKLDKESCIKGAIKAAGVKRGRAVEVYGEVVGPDAGEEPRTKPRRKGKGLAEFKRLHDKDTITRNRIESALQSLGEAWEYESEFVQRAGVTYADLGNYREAYEGNWVFIKREQKRAWAGSKELAAQMRELV